MSKYLRIRTVKIDGPQVKLERPCFVVGWYEKATWNILPLHVAVDGVPSEFDERDFLYSRLWNDQLGLPLEVDVSDFPPKRAVPVGAFSWNGDYLILLELAG